MSAADVGFTSLARYRRFILKVDLSDFVKRLYSVLYPILSVSIALTNYLILGSYKCSPRA